MAEETKKKLSEANKGRQISERQLECLQLGRVKWTKERCEQASIAHQGENSSSKLTESDVINILNMIKQHEPYSEIRDKYGISSAMISSIKHRKRWKHLYQKYPELYDTIQN